MIDRIRELEAVARRLEPSAAERASLLEPVVRYSNDFLDRIRELPAYVTTADKGAGLLDSPVGEEPAAIGPLLELLQKQVDTPGLNPASPGHLGYIPGGGLFHSALGDFLADVTNRFAGVFFASPGAARMEQMLTDWMASIVSFPATSAGNLTSGGSIANLIGIVTARDARQISAREIERSAIYLTAHAHHSVDKALRIAGLRECPVRHVPMDGRHRMDAAALESLIAADLRAGLRPWLVVASAGTTDVGAIDPMASIAEIASRHGLWFHLDGAYGAFFVLCPEGRRKLAGIEGADSLVMDPHKGLFLPYGTGAVLVKERQALHDAHYYVANYMQDTLHERHETSAADLSPELSRSFRGLRLWLPLKLCGLAPFRAALEEKLLLAQHFHDRIQRLPGFEAGAAPELSVVTFRFVPERGDADAFNERLVQEVRKDGRVFLTSSRLDGRFTLRLAALSFRTHLDTIELALEVLRGKVRELTA